MVAANLSINYGSLIYIGASFMAFAGLMYLYFLYQFITQFLIPALFYRSIPKSIFVCLMMNIAILLLLIPDFLAQISIKSVRMTDFNIFVVCYHAYTKTLLMVVMSYLLPMQLTEMESWQTRHFLQGIIEKLDEDIKIETEEPTVDIPLQISIGRDYRRVKEINFING